MKVTKRSKIFLIFGLIAVLVLTALLVVGLCERAQTPAYAQTEAVAVADDTTAGAQENTDTAAAQDDGENSTGWKAVAAGIAIGLAAAAGAIGMGIAISKTNESIARQPEGRGKTPLYVHARTHLHRDGHHLCARCRDPDHIRTLTGGCHAFEH